MQDQAAEVGLPLSGFEHRAFMDRRDDALIHPEPAVHATRAKLPRRPAARIERRVVNVEIHCAAIEVDRDDVALVEPLAKRNMSLTMWPAKISSRTIVCTVRRGSFSVVRMKASPVLSQSAR